MNLQERYNQNRPDEVMGQREMSPKFFQTLSEQGPFAAIQWVRDDIQEHGHNNATLKAMGLIVGSAILATGLTKYVESIHESQTENDFSILQQAGLLLYAGSVGLIMAGHSEVEVDRSYAVAHDIDGRPIIIHGGGGMTEEQAKEAIKKGFY